MADAPGEAAGGDTAAAAGVEAAEGPGGIVGLGRSRLAWGDCRHFGGPWAAALRDCCPGARRIGDEGDDHSH